MPELKTLCVGTTILDPLLSALGNPDDDDNNGMGGLGPGNVNGGSNGEWVCQRLNKLALRNCHGHSESVKKLVKMIEARCPGTSPSAGGGASAGSSGGSNASSSTSTSSGSTSLSSSTSSSSNSGGPVKRLKKLELHDCANSGQDVVDWLRNKVGDLVCTEVPPDTAKWAVSPW